MQKRMALMGMHLEANAFAPVSTEADFRSAGYYVGEEITNDLAQANPRTAAELSGFITEMDDQGIALRYLNHIIMVDRLEPSVGDGQASADTLYRLTQTIRITTGNFLITLSPLRQ